MQVPVLLCLFLQFTHTHNLENNIRTPRPRITTVSSKCSTSISYSFSSTSSEFSAAVQA